MKVSTAIAVHCPFAHQPARFQFLRPACTPTYRRHPEGLPAHRHPEGLPGHRQPEGTAVGMKAAGLTACGHRAGFQ